MDRDKILKMGVILAGIVVIATGLSKYLRRDSMSLTEYARLQNIPLTQSPEPLLTAAPSPDADKTSPEHSSSPFSPDPETENDSHFAAGSQTPDPDSSHTSATPRPETVLSAPTQLTGASLNDSSQLEQRVTLEEGFYYEPLSTQLCRYITGISFPASEGAADESAPEITFGELRYVHILHYDFEGNPTEGELICNEFIAQDLVEIFYELYRNEYQLEKVLLIDEYDGDDNASMEDNNTSCFNYRPVEGSTSLSRHALGLAIDINPLYNPYITYAKTGEETVLPASAAAYADRSVNFPYKIDENDLCYKLFIQHGFTWGGNWNNVKDYQHFQKAK